MTAQFSAGAPVVTGIEEIPVAGHDSMLLNLSCAHGPFFARNVVILRDNAGHTGVGEVPVVTGLRSAAFGSISDTANATAGRIQFSLQFHW